MSGTSLKNLSPADYFRDMIRFSNDGSGVMTSAIPIYDGAGERLPISISVSAVAISPSAVVSAASDVSAATLGVPVGGIYRAGSDLKIRLA